MAHRRERPRDVGGDEPRAGERQHEQRREPAQPLQAEDGLEALARQHHPEFVLVDVEAHPEAFLAVVRVGEARVLAERQANLLGDALEQRVVGQRLGLLARGDREDAQTLGLVQLDQQLAAQHRVGVDQRRPRQVDGADGLLRKLARARFALIDAVDLERCQHRGDDEQRDEQECTGEERHLGCESSGTKT